MRTLGERPAGWRARLAVVATLAVLGLLGAGAGTAFGQGTLALCQSSANGVGGMEFQFSVNGGSPFALSGGRCSGPLAVAHGTVSVAQLQSEPASSVSGISVLASRLVRSVSPNPNLAQRRVVVFVPEGSTALNGTRVTFTNASGDGGGGSGDDGGAPGGGTGGAAGAIEVCKAMAPGEPAFDGRPFEFRLDGGRKFIVRAGRCTPPIPVGAGDHTVAEVGPAQFEVDSVVTLPADRLVSQSPSRAA